MRSFLMRRIVSLLIVTDNELYFIFLASLQTSSSFPTALKSF